MKEKNKKNKEELPSIEIKPLLNLEGSISNHDKLKDNDNKLMVSYDIKEYYGRTEKIRYIDEYGKIKTKTTSKRVNKDPEKITDIKIMFGKNLIEVFHYKNTPNRMLCAINHDKNTLSEVTDDDIRELNKASMKLRNKKHLMGEYCNKSLINQNERLRKYNKVKKSINGKGEII